MTTLSSVICKVPQSSIEFQAQIELQEGQWLVDGKNNKSDIEYIFKHGQVNKYAVEDVSNNPDTTKKQSSFWTELQDRKETVTGCQQAAIAF
jgi:hypothetical protein